MTPTMMIEYSRAERMAVRDDARLSFGGCSDGGRDGPFYVEKRVESGEWRVEMDMVFTSRTSQSRHFAYPLL